jgi:hypothetical protein
VTISALIAGTSPTPAIHGACRRSRRTASVVAAIARPHHERAISRMTIALMAVDDNPDAAPPPAPSALSAKPHPIVVAAENRKTRGSRIAHQADCRVARNVKFVSGRVGE